MTLKNNRAPLLYYVKLCAPFHRHQWIQTGITVRKHSNWINANFVPRDLGIFWRMTLKNNRAPLLCCFKLCASFHSYHCIQTEVTVQKRTIWVKIDDFFSRVTLKFDGSPDLRNNRAPLLSNFKLCASFHRHIWIQIGVTVRKRLSWALTYVTLNFELWPWPFAWTSCLSMVITPNNFRMVRWQEHCQKVVTDGRTDGQTDGRTDGKACS